MGRVSKRGRWTAGALVLLAVLGLGVWLWPRAESPAPLPEASVPPTAPPTAAAPPPRPSAARPAVSAAVPSAPPESGPPGSTPAQPPEAPPVELPATTQLLAEEFYPGTTEWEDVPVDESHQQHLRILPRRYNVVAPRPLVVLLEVTDARGRRQALSAPHVRMRSLEDASRPWIDVPVRDDGSGEDTRAGDLQYTATLRPTREQQRQLLGWVLIEGSVEVPGVGTRTIPAVLLYTLGPRARLTGRWRDSMRDGHLELEAEVEVEQPGLFTLMAQVFGPHLEPLAWVKQTQPLEAGRGTLTLEVFGKVLHDLGIDGPYRVRQVLLSREQENSSDYDPGETIEEAHQTRPYRASDFSAEPYIPPPRTVEEVTADHPSQRDKPPPERTRDTGTPGSRPPSTPSPSAPALPTNLGP